jgi:hypothetical protein
MESAAGLAAGFFAVVVLGLLGFEAVVAAVEASSSSVMRAVFAGRSGLNGGALRLFAG